jgi:hypothetical protein
MSKAVRTLAVAGAVAAAAASLLARTPAGEPAKAADAKPVAKADVVAAVDAWCAGLVEIGKVHEAGGDARAAAAKFIDATYDYADGRVFFRPTLAASPRAFRNTREGALAYFVGGDPAFPEDGGFALKPWVKVWADNDDENNGVQVHGDVAVAMGNIHLRPKDGEAIHVDKTFVFRRGKDGKLRLIAHKSALPNAPAK